MLARLLLLLPAACALLAAAPAAAAPTWTLSWTVHTAQVPIAGADGSFVVGADGEMTPGADAPTPEPSTETATVVLGADWVLLQQGESRTLWDFGVEQITWFDDAARSWRRASLHADVGYRESELANRVFLSQALAAGSVTMPGFSPVELEVMFGIPAGPSLVPLPAPVTTEAGGQRFTTPDGGALSEARPGRTRKPRPAKAGFARFVTHAWHLHPTARAALVGAKTWPEAVEFTWIAGIFARTETWTLTEVARGREAKPAPPAEYSTMLADAEDVEYVLMAVAATDVPSLGAVIADMERRVEISVQKGDHFDAFLAALELTLQRDVDASELLRSLARPAMEDPRMEQFMAALGAQTEEEVRASMPTYAALRSADSPHTRILKVLEANLAASLADATTARRLFVEYLLEQPHSAGPLRDFGQLLMASYQHPDGFRCFDAARRVDPDHDLVKHIGEWEQGLRERNPDFY